MARWSHEIVEIERLLEGKDPPAAIHSSPGEWYAKDVPIGVHKASPIEQWSHAQDTVRIPLFPYLTGSVGPAECMAYAWQLGLLAYEEADKILPRPDLRQPHRTFHLVFGRPLQQADGSFRFWLGFAVKVG